MFYILSCCLFETHCVHLTVYADDDEDTDEDVKRGCYVPYVSYSACCTPPHLNPAEDLLLLWTRRLCRESPAALCTCEKQTSPVSLQDMYETVYLWTDHARNHVIVLWCTVLRSHRWLDNWAAPTIVLLINVWTELIFTQSETHHKSDRRNSAMTEETERGREKETQDSEGVWPWLWFTVTVSNWCVSTGRKYPMDLVSYERNTDL